MKVYRTDEIRNVVLLGHGGSGKTSLAEAMLYVSGATNRMGKISESNTVSDFDKEEQKRGFSISTSLVPIEWEKAKINILDTPGYFDFVGEVEEAVSAADAAVIVVSGKAGVVNVHLGDSTRCMDLIERVIDETEIPASQLLPTHVNRNEMLFCKAIEYALKGGAVDFTGNEDIDYWETICDEVRVCKGMKRMLEAGVNPNRMTISSDGQGSLPMYSKDGEFLGMGVGQSSCLLKEVKECVFKADIPLEIALSTITSNPAEILRLNGKGKIEEGYDADLCILDQDLQLVEVIARGKTVYTK